MRFIIKLPPSGKLDGYAIIAKGEGLDWEVSQILMTSLYEGANEGIEYENAVTQVLSEGEVAPKGSLTYGKRLAIITKPYASNKFVKGYAVVTQDIRDHQDNSVGYVVAMPDGQVARVKTEELLSYCANARERGDVFLQNMQYVGTNTLKSSHLKNYENRVVPVYTLPAHNKLKSGIETEITHIYYVLEIKPEQALDFMLVVEDPHEVQKESILENIDKVYTLLKTRLQGNIPQTDESKMWVNNYIRFISQFPNDYAVLGLSRLLKETPQTLIYLKSSEFKEKQPNVYEKFTRIAEIIRRS